MKTLSSLVIGNPTSLKYFDNHKTWVVVFENAINSVSTIDKATVVMLDSHLDNKRDIFHLNNENNQLERWVRPPKDIH